MAPNAPALKSPEEEAQFHVMAGEMAAGRQQPGVAAQEFLQALDLVPNPDLAARATALALAAGDETLGLAAARKWLSIDASSLEAREIITRLALRAGLDDEAYAQCQAIVRDHPGGNDDGFRHVALLLAQEPGKAGAGLALMDRLVAQWPKLAGAYQAQALLALRYNKTDSAEKAAREALRLQPGSKEASLLLVGALVKKGDVAGADQLMEGLARGGADASDLRLGYARLLLESNQRAAAREQLDRLLKSEPNNADAQLTLGLALLDDHKPEEAEPHFQFLLKKGGERASDAHYYLGRIDEQRRQPSLALDHYEKVSSGSQALDASVRRAAMLAKLGRIDEARTTLSQLRQQFPPLADRFTLAEGEILLDANRIDQALDLYNKALTQDPDDGDLLYSRSLVHERAGQLDQAEADLRRILDKSPNDARALNALGYMLIVHSERLEEAQKLIGRAIELTPDEPAVIDSLGWLRYRQGRTQEALPLLQKAYELFPDPEVAAHLGEVLWASGDRDRARAVWARASRDDPDNTALRDTVKRLAQ
jgi:tetratricopeptide (TPR) repeat protein